MGFHLGLGLLRRVCSSRKKNFPLPFCCVLSAFALYDNHIPLYYVGINFFFQFIVISVNIRGLFSTLPSAVL